MKRLSLEELKAQQAQKLNTNINLESIKGGDTDWCHFWDTLGRIAARNVLL